MHRVCEHDCKNFFSEVVNELVGELAGHDSAVTVGHDGNVFSRRLEKIKKLERKFKKIK